MTAPASWSAEQEYRLLALADVAARCVRQSGNDAPWDSVTWTRDWVSHPIPALGTEDPAELLRSEEGVARLVGLLMRSMYGVFS